MPAGTQNWLAPYFADMYFLFERIFSDLVLSISVGRSSYPRIRSSRRMIPFWTWCFPAQPLRIKCISMPAEVESVVVISLEREVEAVFASFPVESF